MSIFIVCRIFPPSDCWFLWTSDSHSEKIISTRVRAATHRSLRRTWVSIRFVPFSWYFWCVRSECTFVYLSISFNGFVRDTEMNEWSPQATSHHCRSSPTQLHAFATCKALTLNPSPHLLQLNTWIMALQSDIRSSDLSSNPRKSRQRHTQQFSSMFPRISNVAIIEAEITVHLRSWLRLTIKG